MSPNKSILFASPHSVRRNYSTQLWTIRGQNFGARSNKIIQILLAAGADPTIANKSGKRPIEYVKNNIVLAELVG